MPGGEGGRLPEGAAGGENEKENDYENDVQTRR